jgi:hypothetical protein
VASRKAEAGAHTLGGGGSRSGRGGEGGEGGGKVASLEVELLNPLY